MTKVNPYKMAVQQVDAVAPYLDVGQGILEKLMGKPSGRPLVFQFISASIHKFDEFLLRI